MPELTIRPTAKFIKAGAIVAAIVFLGLEIAYLVYRTDSIPYWVMVLPLVIFLWPASRALRRKYTVAVVSADRLRFETGMTTKSTRNIQLSKIQDVKVEQRIVQRMFGVGDLSIETAGEASRLTILNVDAPQSLADEIMNRSQKGAATA